MWLLTWSGGIRLRVLREVGWAISDLYTLEKWFQKSWECNRWVREAVVFSGYIVVVVWKG